MEGESNYDGRVPENIVLLHGFGGTHRAWDGVIERLPPERYRPLAIDLPGHGVHANRIGRHSLRSYPQSGQRGVGEEAITFDCCVEHVLARSPERFALCGYSLGGRIALHVALAAPQRVSRLVLVSSAAGSRTHPSVRSAARPTTVWPKSWKRIPFEDFIERWRTQPLFAADPPEVGALAREDQRRNRPDALAAVLRGIGTGEMAPLWDRLAELRCR